MRAGIFFSDTTYIASAQRILRHLRASEVPGSAFRLTRNWEKLDGQELGFHLQQLSHVILLLTPQIISSRWFAYLMGFAAGRELPLYFIPGDLSTEHESAVSYDQNVTGLLPNYARHLPIFSSLDDMISELQRERDIDAVVQRVEYAKAELTAMGYALTEKAMVSAVKDGISTAVAWFLQTGFSPNTEDSIGVPVLNLAARGLHHEVMQALLEADADIDAVGADRGTTALMESSVQGDADGVRLLLEYNADLNLQSSSGQTALMMAIGEGKVKTAQLLLDRGAAVSPVDALGMTARKYAALFQQTQLLAAIDATADRVDAH